MKNAHSAVILNLNIIPNSYDQQMKGRRSFTSVHNADISFQLTHRKACSKRLRFYFDVLHQLNFDINWWYKPWSPDYTFPCILLGQTHLLALW
ncbi:hypothetical protein BHE74_00008608 [Ensete ventricosum]|nr:hypothetical protein BHE74_00008608 [Ensete ventricosum]